MAGIQRQLLVRAPGFLKYGASTYIYSITPIVVNQVTNYKAIYVESIGQVRDVIVDRYLEITCRPPEFEGFSAIMTPYATMATGASIFGDTDVPLVFYGRDGKTRTFHAAAPTAFGIAGKIGEPLLNQITFMAILKNGAEPGDANAYFTEATAAYPGDANFSKAACITPALKCAWGSDAPYDSFYVSEGLDIAFQLDLQPEYIESLGTIDQKFSDCLINARGIPVGVTMTQLYAASGFNTALGSQAVEHDLILSGAGFHFTAYNAQMKDPELGFSAARRIPGQTLWSTSRTVTAGAVDAAFRLDTAAPVAP